MCTRMSVSSKTRQVQREGDRGKTYAEEEDLGQVEWDLGVGRCKGESSRSIELVADLLKQDWTTHHLTVEVER